MFLLLIYSFVKSTEVLYDIMWFISLTTFLDVLAPSSGEILSLINEVILADCEGSINQSIYPLQLY